MSEPNKSYCPLPFVHFALKPDGKAKPCCRFAATHPDEKRIRNWQDLNHNVIGSRAVLNSVEFEQIRQDMIAGREVPGCWKCIREEAGGGGSMRTLYNSIYPDYDNKVQLRYLEISFGNYCNLSCRTCDSSLSTPWRDDDAALSEVYEERKAYPKIIDIPFNWLPSDFEHVDEIKFVGGEPMLNPNFRKFLQTVLESGRGKQIRLIIFTNCSWMPKQAVLNMLEEFESVSIWLSIDSVGEQNDYIRNGSKWKTLSANAQRYMDMERASDVVRAKLTPTLNLLNISNIDLLIEWWISERMKRDLEFVDHGGDGHDIDGGIIFSSVFDPVAYSIENIPNKEAIIKKYEQLIAELPNHIMRKRTYGRVISLLKKDLDATINLVPFIELNKDLDRLREQKFEEIFPDLYKDICDELKRQGMSYEDIKGRLK